jgi:MFS family permease
LSLLILPVVGAGMMITMASTNTIVQTVVEEHLRGRVMAFYTMAFLGTAPIGSLLAGVIAQRIGSEHTILLGGLGCVFAGGWFALRLPRLRDIVRPIYVERGILAAAEIDADVKSL